jgi:hypothetical protein
LVFSQDFEIDKMRLGRLRQGGAGSGDPSSRKCGLRFHVRLKYGDPLFRVSLAGSVVCALLFHLLDLNRLEFLLVLCPLALGASLIETLLRFFEENGLNLEAINQNLHSLDGRSGVAQIRSERADFGEQGLGRL